LADLGLAAANGLAFLLCVLFLGYVSLIFIPFLRHRPRQGGDEHTLQWHFLVPCRDEEAVIERTVCGLLESFPSAHVWAVDDASEDATLAILRRLELQSPRVHVVARTAPCARQGKGAALNAGWRVIDAAIPPTQPRDLVAVSVVDADAVLDPQALALISGPSYFGDPGVGAVQIQVRIRPDPFRAVDDQPSIPRRSRLLIALQDVEFTGPIAAMQMLRSRTGSVAMGGNGQFTRLSVLNRVAEQHGTPWHGALLEDFELGLHVLLAGSRTGYCHNTFVVQEGVPTARALLRQRSRWAQGSMQCLRYLRDVLQTSHLSSGGTLEIAYFLFSPWVQLVGGVVYATLFSSAAYYAATDPLGVGHWWGGGAWGILPLFLLFGLSPFMLWAFMYRSRVRPDLSLWQATGLGLVNAVYVYFHQAATWWAFYRVMTARTDWKKTVRYSLPQAVDSLPVRSGPAARPQAEAFARLRASSDQPARLTGAAAEDSLGTSALVRLRQHPADATWSSWNGMATHSDRAIAGLRAAQPGRMIPAHDNLHTNQDNALWYAPATPAGPPDRSSDARRLPPPVTARH
jgi:cellulose synthase/poly-beta-1,6-N-acetylglucosamine synthase-like glycosyltransferase